MKMIEGKNMKGYLWYSNQSNPIVYDGQELKLSLDDDSNPFVIEGQLYDGNDNTSYSIKYVDGEYLVREYPKDSKTTPDSKCEIRDKFFQSNRMDGKVLHFKEVWNPVPDLLCGKIKVLQPAEMIFVGFKEKEKEK